MARGVSHAKLPERAREPRNGVPPRGSLAGPTTEWTEVRTSRTSYTRSQRNQGWAGVAGRRTFHVYLCFSTVVSSTTRSTISPAMSSAALRSSSFFWATSTRAACQADQ